MIETACPAAFNPELAQYPDRVLTASLSNAQFVEFLPALLQRTFAQWKDRRATEAVKKSSKAVFGSLDARALYDVGATDIVNFDTRVVGIEGAQS